MLLQMGRAAQLSSEPNVKAEVTAFHGCCLSYGSGKFGSLPPFFG